MAVRLCLRAMKALCMVSWSKSTAALGQPVVQSVANVLAFDALAGSILCGVTMRVVEQPVAHFVFSNPIRS